jgi:hypothetical protein
VARDGSSGGDRGEGPESGGERGDRGIRPTSRADSGPDFGSLRGLASEQRRHILWLERDRNGIRRDVGPVERAETLLRMADSHQKLAALDSALARPSERIADQPGADPFPHSSEALRLRNQALEEAVAARDPAMKSMAHNALALHYASEGAWELALPHADQADVSQQDALKLAGRLFHDETQGPFQKQVERDARDRRLRLLELSLDQGDLVQARQLLNIPG